MDYTKNVKLLEQAVLNHAFLIPISRHRNADGSMNINQFKENWEKQMEPFDKIRLWDQTPGFDERDPLQKEPYLVFIPAEDPGGSAKGTVLVAHGGGFSIRTGCEGPNVAWYFHQQGFHTAILTYRLSPYSRYDCIADMQRAIRVLRSKKEELGISGKIAVMGFSAGGMLCANCATMYDSGNRDAKDPVERESSKPDAAVIGYGAITAISFPKPFLTPVNYEEDLCGNNLKERYELAAEKHVSWDTPPFFIWQTLSDDGRFGMILAKQLQDVGVPYELHIFEGGTHGIGLADGENDLGMSVPHVSHWGRLCAEWLEMKGIK